MKKSLVLMAALACAGHSLADNFRITKVDTVNAYQLQDVLVTSIRANKQTPVAYKNLNQKDYNLFFYILNCSNFYCMFVFKSGSFRKRFCLFYYR